MPDLLSQLLNAAASQDEGQAGPALLTQPEAERMIEQLKTWELVDVGSARWQTQRDWIGRMNMQAHTNASTHSEEFIVELLVSLDRMQSLVHDLLVIETWKQHVLPHLKKHLADKCDVSYVYMVLYHECTLANLLELTLFHSHAMESLPEEHLLELTDWAYRKLVYLASPQGRSQADAAQLSAKELLARGKAEELEDKISETEFGAAMCAVTIIRYLADNVTKLPLSVMSRLVSSNDVPMALVALLDNPPWKRRRAGKQEVWQDNTWVVVPGADRLKLTQADAQTWLALNSLIVEPRCRAKYQPDDWRRDKLLSLKRYMNELLFDQVPVLKDLQRTLDEMALGVAPDAATAKSAALLLETVPQLRDALLRGAPNGRLVALQQAQTVFSEEETKKAAKSTMEALMKQLDFLMEMQPEPEVPVHKQSNQGTGSGSGQGAGQEGDNGTSSRQPQDEEVGPIKISCWRKAHDSGVFERWTDYVMEVDPAKPAEPVTLEQLQGLRYRLLPLDPDTTRPLPTNGRIAVRLGHLDHTINSNKTSSNTSKKHQSQQGDEEPLMAQALLQLPEVPVKSLAGEKPPVVWVNVGILAEDGLVLQLKLKKHDTASERDKVSGVWYTYRPVGGALTVLRQDRSKALTSSGTVMGDAGSSSMAQRGRGGERKDGSSDVLVPAVGLQGIASTSGSAPSMKAANITEAHRPTTTSKTVDACTPQTSKSAAQPSSSHVAASTSSCSQSDAVQGRDAGKARVAAGSLVSVMSETSSVKTAVLSHKAIPVNTDSKATHVNPAAVVEAELISAYEGNSGLDMPD